MFLAHRELYDMGTPTFILIPFKAGARGKAKAGTPQTFRDEGKAVTAADRLLPRVQGAVVIETIAGDEFAEPRLVKTFGSVPEAMLESPSA
jgi:hypothetical protein